MNYFYKHNFVVRFLSIICLVVILCMSPCAKYIDASCVGIVYATGLEIPATMAAESVIEFMIAFFATLALGDAAYENRDALAESYMEYVDIKIENDQLTQDTCMMIYDKTADAVKSIPWDDFRDDLKNVHDISVDKLTDTYAKYCPQLLGSMKDFVTDVLSGDVYVEGLSDSIIDYAPVTASDIANQWNGSLYMYNCHGVVSYTFTHPYTKVTDHRVDLYDLAKDNFYPIAGFVTIFTDSQGIHYGFDTYAIDSVEQFGSLKLIGTHTNYINGEVSSSRNFSASISAIDWADKLNSYDVSFDISAGFPIFSSLEAVENYLQTGTGYKDAINFGTSMYDNITDNVDLPPFYKTWQQELWERVANAPDVGIGSYGAGVGTGVNDWADDIPWVGLGSLGEYVDSVQDVYEKTIDDIINGVYDPPKDIPDTYGGAWEDSVADTWDDVVDLPVEHPGVNDPTIPVNPDKPVNPDIPIDIPSDSVVDIPIEDIVPTVNDSFIDIAASLKYKFPFSIPWDIHYIFTVLADTPKAPYFELPLVIERYGINEKIVIDMSRFQVLSNLSRSMFSMLFAIFLINLTFKVVAMRKEE